MNHSRIPARLSPEQVRVYHREGFVVYPDPVLPIGKFEGLKAQFEEMLEALPSDVRPESMDVPHFDHPKLFEWLLSDEVLDLVEPLIGENIALFASHFICKPKGDGKRVPWHEDSFYWKSLISPIQVVTVWLAIDPSTRENGAMRVVPRSLSGDTEHEPVDPKQNVLSWEAKKELLNEETVVTIELEPNHASLHDGRLMHGSPANTSSLRRCGYTMRYMPTSVKLNENASSRHNIYLARGRDLAGNKYADPTKAYHDVAKLRRQASKSGH
jgi:hypothetical protein